MSYKNSISREDVKRATAETAAAQPKKLTTGEYRQILSQQYERMAQHQQIIEAEYGAEHIR
jgi:hypothetical protein